MTTTRPAGWVTFAEDGRSLECDGITYPGAFDFEAGTLRVAAPSGRHIGTIDLDSLAVTWPDEAGPTYDTDAVLFANVAAMFDRPALAYVRAAVVKIARDNAARRAAGGAR